jgi:hypothetical protein
VNFPLNRLPYTALAKQGRAQENYNFHKVASILAEYGFTSMRLTNDWKAADFLAVHLNGEVLKVQLKGRLEFRKLYMGQDIYMCFRRGNAAYLFPHDLLFEQATRLLTFHKTSIWHSSEAYNWSSTPVSMLKLLEPYKLTSQPEPS